MKSELPPQLKQIQRFAVLSGFLVIGIFVFFSFVLPEIFNQPLFEVGTLTITLLYVLIGAQILFGLPVAFLFSRVLEQKYHHKKKILMQGKTESVKCIKVLKNMGKTSAVIVDLDGKQKYIPIASINPRFEIMGDIEHIQEGQEILIRVSPEVER